MEGKKQKRTVQIIAAIVIIVVLIVIFSNSGVDVSAELTSCINENAKLYILEGCGACVQQEAMFGEHYSLFEDVDCKYEQEECNLAQIQYTPTWIIKGKQYVGVQTIKDLKKYTGC
ncbi:hypothetical protein ACFLZJ_00355 [Nanoarchaeota archaeon]